MNNTLDIGFLLHDTRARVYLLWAFLASTGFVTTHYYQKHEINALWFGISFVGLAYMFKVMPLKVKSMRNIFLAWLIPITIGMSVTAAAFYVDAWTELIAYLGAFWLFVMAAGYTANSLVDKPSTWYLVAAVLNVAAGFACFYIDSFTAAQYLVAAIISGWSMLNLWVFRT
jgi:hypothetical protein